MSNLNTAIQLVRQGNTAQAQKILETIVRTETDNVPAWLWYAQTWPSDEMRLKVLVACLNFNPGDEKVLQAIRFIKGRSPARVNTPVKTTVVQDASPSEDEKPIEIPPIFVQILAQEPLPVQAKSAFDWDELERAQAHTETGFAAQEQTGGSRSAFNWDEFEKASAPAAPVLAADAYFTNEPARPAETKVPRRSYRFYEVWWIALTKQDVRAYAELLDDPEAGLSRALEWQVYSNLAILLLSGLVAFFQFQTILAMPEFKKLGHTFPILNSSNLESMLFGFLVAFILLGVILGVLGLLINGAFQNFMAGMFGGTGNFGRTVYALSAYLIPLSIIMTVMGFIPLVNCAAILVSGYAFLLNVRALQAAHGLNGGRATIIVAIPSILLFIVMVGSFVFLSSWLRTALPSHTTYPIMP